MTRSRLVAKRTALDDQWQELMSLCENEARFTREGRHPRLVTLLGARIGELAAEMGFSPRRIATREFRAERDGERITRVITE
jgi:AraC-like DNA-binding protein